MQNFNRQAPAPAPATPPPAPTQGGPQRSKYGGIQCGVSRDPMLGLGTYRVRIVGAEQGYNPGNRRSSYKTKVEVVDAAEGAQTSPGAQCVVINFETAPGMRELKAMFVHAAGYGPSLAQVAEGVGVRELIEDGDAAYDAFDEAQGYLGSVIEATAGAANGAPSIAGRLVDVNVARGKDIPSPQTGASTGDYFRAYTWGVVPADDQPSE